MSDTSTTTPKLGELTISRTYEAPRDLVFRCMTEAEHLTHFWGPIGVTTPIENITIDPRAGGVFETIMVNDSDGEEYTMTATFVAVEPPERIVWTEAGVEGGILTTVTFNDLGDGTTEVVTHQTNLPEMYMSPEAQSGLKSSFDRFAAYLATL